MRREILCTAAVAAVALLVAAAPGLAQERGEGGERGREWGRREMRRPAPTDEVSNREILERLDRLARDVEQLKRQVAEQRKEPAKPAEARAERAPSPQKPGPRTAQRPGDDTREAWRRQVMQQRAQWFQRMREAHEQRMSPERAAMRRQWLERMRDWRERMADRGDQQRRRGPQAAQRGDGPAQRLFMPMPPGPQHPAPGPRMQEHRDEKARGDGPAKGRQDLRRPGPRRTDQADTPRCPRCGARLQDRRAGRDRDDRPRHRADRKMKHEGKGRGGDGDRAGRRHRRPNRHRNDD